MEIKKLEKKDLPDFRKLIEIFKDVFENDCEIPDDEYLKKLLSNKDFLVFVVKKNGEVIGGLTIYILHQYYNSKPLAYIYDVGIAKNFQGQGIGKKLIYEVCEYCKQNGIESAFVQAEDDDEAAINFYNQTKFNNQIRAIHFNYLFE